MNIPRPSVELMMSQQIKYINQKVGSASSGHWHAWHALKALFGPKSHIKIQHKILNLRSLVLAPAIN